jgi:uncharacterized membrane protein YkvA (DUF1232 family)
MAALPPADPFPSTQEIEAEIKSARAEVRRTRNKMRAARRKVVAWLEARRRKEKVERDEEEKARMAVYVASGVIAERVGGGYYMIK